MNPPYYTYEDLITYSLLLSFMVGVPIGMLFTLKPKKMPLTKRKRNVLLRILSAFIDFFTIKNPKK